MNRILILTGLSVIAFFHFGCARVQTLNLKSHPYSERPKHILWIQLAGFTEEHIPLLRFNVSEANYKTNLEKVDCVGKMWNYDLYQLRPEASKGFLSQMTGSKNIKGTCEDSTLVPFWSSLDEIGYQVSLLESGASAEQALEKSLSCSGNMLVDLAKLRYFRMGPDLRTGVQAFHYQDSPDKMYSLRTPGLYYDRSCQKGICFSSLSSNFKNLWALTSKDLQRSVFIIRDFNFQNALKKKDLSLAKETLLEIDRIIAAAKKEKSDELLVVLSGAEPLPIEFPLQGKEWAEFEKDSKNIFYKNTSLMSPALASGPMAENFCGIYDESEMTMRLIFKPEGKKFNWDIVNPF